MFMNIPFYYSYKIIYWSLIKYFLETGFFLTSYYTKETNNKYTGLMPLDKAIS